MYRLFVPLILATLSVVAAPTAVAQCPCFTPLTILPGNDPTESAPIGAVAVDGEWALATRNWSSGASPAAAIFLRRVAGRWIEHQIVVPIGSTPLEEFGSAAVIDGDVAVVGSRMVASGGTGSAYVFRRSGTTWVQEQQIVATDGGLGFGRTVDADGGRLIVGAPGGPPDNEAVYVYSFNGSTWVLEQKIGVPPTPEIRDFGRSAAIAGDLIAIGESTTQPLVLGSGRVYIYQWTGTAWSLQATLYPPVLATNDKFGQSIDFDGSTLVASWPGTVFVQGVVVFERVGSQWNLAQVLPHGGSRIAALDGSRVAISHPSDDVVAEHSGAIHVYEKQAGSWEYIQSFADAEGMSGQSFLGSIDLSGDTIIESAGLTGEVYFFSVSNPEVETFEAEAQKIIPAANPSGSPVGGRVAMDGGHLLLGVRGEDTGAPNTGAVYAYRRSGGAWANEIKIAGTVAGGQYGSAVAVQGEVAMVGARTELQGRGRVHVLQWNGSAWSASQVIDSPFPETYEFGSSIAMQGDVAVVGADGPDNHVGRVAVLEKSSNGQWSTTQLIVPSGPAGESPGEFGTDVSIDGDTFVVGAPYTWTPTHQAGAAFVYRKSAGTWNLEAVLKGSNSTLFDHLGAAVSLQGDRVLVGAPDAGTSTIQLGAVYAFERTGTTWTEVDILHADHLGALRFGTDVEMRGTEAVIGVGSDFDCGAVYQLRYVNGSWSRVQRLHHASSFPGDRLGVSLAVDEGYVAAFEAGTAPLGSVNIYPLGKVALYTFYNHPAAGEPLSFETTGGDFGAPGLLVITGINGLPLFAPVVTSTFGANGAWSLGITVPALPSLPGASVTFASYTVGSSGEVIGSNPRTVAFE